MPQRLVSLSAVCAAWVAALAAAAQPWPATAEPLATALPGVFAYASPPTGFDPLAATPEQLDANGFPPRPVADAPAAARASWKRAVTFGARRIIPTLRLTGLKHGPSNNPRLVANTVYSGNWGGQLLLNTVPSYGPSSFYQITGDFTVPSVSQAFGTCRKDWDYSALWVGIDGFNTPDVMQAGVEADAYCQPGYSTTRFYAWYEWYPAASVLIGGFPVYPGNSMTVNVWTTSPTVAHVSMIDYSTDATYSMVFYAPPNITLRGNSAEWVVERPGLPSLTLADYAQAFFANMFASDYSGNWSSPGYPASGVGSFPYSMVDNAGAVISVSQLMGPWGMWVQAQNSATQGSLP